MPSKYTTQPFQKRPWHIRLEDTISDDVYRRRGEQYEGATLPMPGDIRFEHAWRGQDPFKNVPCDGECWFRWGVNRSGSTIAQCLSAAYAANQTPVTADVAGTVAIFEDTAQFIEHEEIGNILHILDNQDSAGAAPEGEWAIIVKNTANRLYLQPNLTVATAIGDTGSIISVGKVGGLAGSGAIRKAVFGVVLASAGIPDNYWGWFLIKGRVTHKIKAATAIAASKGLIIDANGLLTISSSSGQQVMLAESCAAVSNDIVSDSLVVDYDIYRNMLFTSA